MKHLSFHSFAVFLTFEIFAVGTSAPGIRTSCILNFTQQPVADIDCDVYSKPVIVLTCSVELISPDNFVDLSAINIGWYFHNGSEYELTTGVNHTHNGGSGEHVQVTSTLKLSGTSDKNYTFLSKGSYYCQVQLTDKTVVSQTSQVFQVLDEDEYTQAATSCYERTFIDHVESCSVYQVIAPSTDHPTDASTAVTQAGTATPQLDESSTSTTTAQDTTSCILHFTQQPITSVDCNVYEADRIVLTCTAIGLLQNHLAGLGDIDIVWYFDNGTEHQVTKEVDQWTQTVRDEQEDIVQITSTLALSGKEQASNQNSAHIEGEGFYYCQVQTTTSAADIRVESSPSQKFQILSRDFHLQASTSCSERTFIAYTESCALNKLTS